MLQNNLIIFNPSRIILEKTIQTDDAEIRKRENNTYLIKIIGYCDKNIKKNTLN